MSDNAIRDQLAGDLTTVLGGHLVTYCCDDHPPVLEGTLDAAAVADRLLAAGWRPPARVITTAEDLDALGFPCVIREIPDDPLEFYPQIWEMACQLGWCRVGRVMWNEDDCTPTLPVEVLVEPKEGDR